MATTPTTATGPARPAVGSAPTQNQQDLNQIVIEYLIKKGYTRTEAQLRMESQGDDPDGKPIAKKGVDGIKLYNQGYRSIRSWVDGTLDIYKPELRRLLWPIFVYVYLQLVKMYYVDGSKQFFEAFQGDFQNEHKDELRQLKPLASPETINDSDLAKKFMGSKYRITLSKMGYSLLVRHLEENLNAGGSIIMHIIQQSLNVVEVDRAADDKHSIRQMLQRAQSAKEDYPQEDEGIPGHNPGSANLEQKPNSNILQRLKLGPLPMEQELLDDVIAELKDEDQKKPPVDGQPTLVDTFQTMIKVEENDEGPGRTDVPLPPSKARDVALEVQKVSEHRARFKIESRTGGVGPAVSVCMFTFHNTNDGINCIEISGDNQLVAAGMAEHYIRVWRIDGQPLPSAIEGVTKPQASRRLVGHHAPVYNASFSPAIELPEPPADEGRRTPSTAPQYLLSASADKTVRLWDLSTWSCLVVYEGHMAPVWDVQWGPFGHYFLTGSRDGTARLWSTEHKSDLRIFAGHDQDVNYVAFHPNNVYVFTGGFDKTVRMWSVTTGHPVRLFTGHAGDITAVSCSPNGKLLASADDSGAIIIWDLAPGKLLKRLRGHDKGGITSLSFSVESNILISGGVDGTVRVWDIQGSTDPNQQGKVVGEGGAGQKVDLSAQAGAGVKKKGKEAVVSPEQISAFPTKKSPIYKVKFTRMNLAIAAGAYLP